MARIKSVDLDQVDGHIAETFNNQTKFWGAPLQPYLIYARRPTLFKAVEGMWASQNKGRVLDKQLVPLINRRVATLNGCVF